MSSFLRSIALPGIGTLGVLAICSIVWRHRRQPSSRPDVDAPCACHAIGPSTGHWGRLVGPAKKIDNNVWQATFETVLPIPDPEARWAHCQIYRRRRAPIGMIPFFRQCFDILLRSKDYDTVSLANPKSGFRIEVLSHCFCTKSSNIAVHARLRPHRTYAVKEGSTIPYGPFAWEGANWLAYFIGVQRDRCRTLTSEIENALDV